MRFEEWWREFWGNSWKDGAPVPDYGDSQGQIEQTKIACQEAWEAAYRQAYSDAYADAAYRKDVQGWFRME